VDTGLKLELETYAGCQRYAREAGWQLVLDPSIKRLDQWSEGRAHYDGILARATQPLVAAARLAGVPMVNLWQDSPALGRMPSVVLDSEAAGVMAAEHLLGRGLRNFAYLGSLKPKASQLEHQGFRARVAQAGYRCTSYRYPHTIFAGDARTWEKFTTKLDEWIGTWRPPVGVFVFQDVFCRFLIDACTARGLSVPGDVAIVGCQNDEIICESMSPSLTSVELGHERMGYEAAKWLDRLMNGEAVSQERTVRVAPALLIPRESSDIFAAPDPLVSRALRFIAERSDRLLRVNEVATETGVSRRTLERKFREMVGHSIAEEMVRLRLNRAKRRLADGAVMIKTVAQEAGFQSVSHFSRVFTRTLGISPSQFRAARRIQLETKH
jgi:LacI family transcriptional regulator